METDVDIHGGIAARSPRHEGKPGIPGLSLARDREGTCGYADEYAEFADLLAIMRHDKKARAGRIRMVLPTRLGAVDIYDDVATSELAAAVAYLAG